MSRPTLRDENTIEQEGNMDALAIASEDHVAPDNGGQFTTGLRVLADLLDEHAAAGSFDCYRHLICVWTKEQLVETVRRLGGRWIKDENPGDYFGMTRDLGGGVSLYVYASRKAVCEAVVVGKQTVKRPAPDALMVEVEEDVIEWRCPPGLLAPEVAACTSK